jgi:hypothetical protein
MRDLAELTAADFEGVAGSIFELTDPGREPLAMRLADVILLPERPGHRQPFALRFEGPRSPVLPQAIHRIRHRDIGDLDIFIGPIASDSAGITYEAVFT